MKAKQIIGLFLPPIALKGYRRLLAASKKCGLYGNFTSWEEAMLVSTGYDSEIILKKTKEALLKVKNGKVAYERDSFLFDAVQYSWPTLSGLMWVAAQSKGRISVLDFGGSLGSSFFQNSAFLRDLPDVRWNVVEQPRYVDVGKECFEDKQLRFYPTIQDCLMENEPNLIIFGSVLQYLEHPFDVLDKLLGMSCNHVIIDRTPFWDGATDRLCVQVVPPSIYSASYPIWIFSRAGFLAHLKDWNIVAEFEAIEGLAASVKATWKGLILTRKNMA
jgi:putative methyltransferase (TIGR04325 family)